MTGVLFEKRVKLAAKMLEENPNVGFDKVAGACHAATGGWMTERTFLRIKSGELPANFKYLNKKANEQKTIKSELKKATKGIAKKGTKQESQLSVEAKHFSKVLIACGIEEASFRMVDGAPVWQVTEKRSFVI